MFRGRGHNALALGELRKLLQQCQGKDDVKYGVKMVENFQRKGQDFSEEVASHFVSMCVRGEQPMAAVKVIAKYKNRIGAWVTPKSFHNLIASALSVAPTEGEDPVKELVAALEVVSRKGVRVNAEDVQELVMRSAVDLETYNKVIAAASRVVDQDAVAEIAALYPPNVASEATPAGVVPDAAAAAEAASKA